VRLRRRDGTYRWHLVRSVPFRDSAGDVGKWLVTATDIEERKSAESVMAGVHDAALAATEAKSRFLATMSHEIRTPMNAVIGMTELLLLSQLSEEQREYIEIVRDSGQSLLRVLNDILDYSKIEAGKLELETVHFDLPAQIESVVELLRAQYQIKDVGLTTSIGAGISAVVAGDPGRLRQILLNLAGNALKFTAPARCTSPSRPRPRPRAAARRRSGSP
jgi:signal transduction histidine kinase